jgi:hypothetical protein
MLWAARLSGLLGPVPSSIYFLLAGSCGVAAGGVAWLSPFWASLPEIPLVEAGALGASAATLAAVGFARRRREAVEAEEEGRRRAQIRPPRF